MRTNLEKISLKDFFKKLLFPSEFSVTVCPTLVLQATGQNITQTDLNDLSCNRLPRLSFSRGLS